MALFGTCFRVGSSRSDGAAERRRGDGRGRAAKEVMIPKIEVTGLGDYARNVGYKTGVITCGFETKTFNYDRGIRLLVDVVDVE